MMNNPIGCIQASNINYQGKPYRVCVFADDFGAVIVRFDVFEVSKDKSLIEVDGDLRREVLDFWSRKGGNK